MKRAVGETVVYNPGAVGTEVGFCMVRKARVGVGPGAPRIPPIAPKGHNALGARFPEFDTEVSTPAAQCSGEANGSH